MYRAAVIVFPKAEELDFVGVWQALGTTEHLSKKVCIRPCLVGTVTGPIKCAHGLTVMVDDDVNDLSKYDMVVVPGGPGVSEAMKNKSLLVGIRKMYEAGKTVCSVCTGAFVLAEAGVLKGKRATTYHTRMDELAKYDVFPVRERVVVEGKVVTGAGVAASIDVGLKIVEIFLGHESARKVSEWIEYRP